MPRKILIGLILILIGCSNKGPIIGPERSEMIYGASFNRVWRATVNVLSDDIYFVSESGVILTKKLKKERFFTEKEDVKILSAFVDSVELYKFLKNDSLRSLPELGGTIIDDYEISYKISVEPQGPWGLAGTKVIIEPDIKIFGWRYGWRKIKSSGIREKLYFGLIESKLKE
jgi:hypothetical protein